ncbi:MAG: hypothetical protein HOH66_17155 [Rhodospirillaceae bacterium]|jgi:hypothetical protein|nr:hypothetical protein [Rhodospirillaceae bacterium]MBT6119592.1 hypothetical protein [Rhodospirillaceae bacterium]
MARVRAKQHECPDCGQHIAVPRRIAWWGGARFRCAACNSALLASDKGTTAYYLRIAVPAIWMLASPWLSYEIVVRFGFERGSLIWLSAAWVVIAILIASFMPRGAMKVEVDRQFQEGWLDRTGLGRAFSGSEWEEKDDEGGGRGRQG